MSYLFKLNPDHPYRPPNWRWERARLLLEHGKTTPGRGRDDHWVDQAYQLRKKLRTAKTEFDRYIVIEDAGAVGMAYVLYDQEEEWSASPKAAAQNKLSLALSGPPPARYELEARLLTGTPLEETAQRFSTSVEAVEAYEALFFNVLDRIENKAYIAQQAIGGTTNDGTAKAITVWKSWGWASRSQEFLDGVIHNIHPEARNKNISHLEWLAMDSIFTRGCKTAMATRLVPITEKTSMRILELQAEFLKATKAPVEEDQPTSNQQELLQGTYKTITFSIGNAMQRVGPHGEARAADLIASAAGVTVTHAGNDDFTFPTPRTLTTSLPTPAPTQE